FCLRQLRQRDDVRHAAFAARRRDDRQRRPVGLGAAAASPVWPAMKSRKIDAVLLLIAFLVLWQALYFAVGADVISAPVPTLARAVALLGNEAFWRHAASTGQAFGFAAAIAIVAGIAIGLWL